MDRRKFVRDGMVSLGSSFVATNLASRGVLSNRSLPTAPAQRPHPSKSQLQWQRDELAMFLHFGVNTFADREWGDGTESPSIFAPTQLDARQWARSARAAGFRSVILTAKHHDGFCLWPTATTKHSVVSSPFRGGTGDVVREMVNACRAEGLRPGLYLSPWDRNNSHYGNSPRYNDLYCDQLTELLTRYGKIAEVWFDGANGEGPNGKRQQYDWPRVWGLVRKLQPDAVMFSDAGPDVRWCGNENGSGGETNWSTVNPTVVTYPGVSGPGVTESLQRGDPNGTAWIPAEADTSIRPGWFYHAAEDTKVRSVDNLYDLYFKSVGRNAKLLLNVPPTRAGLLHEVDVANLSGFRARLDQLRDAAITRGLKGAWHSTGARTAEATVTFNKPQMISAFRLAEMIEQGQSVSRWSLSAANGADSRVISRGTTIGYARMEKFAPVLADRITLAVEDAVDAPYRVAVTAYA